MTSEARGERTRLSLLDAAMTIIARQGVSAATQRAVALAAGSSLASTTYHFGTRAELLAATLEYAGDIASAEIDGFAEQIRSGEVDPLTACLAYIDRQRTGVSISGAAVYELAVAAARVPRLRPANERFVQSLRDLFAPFTESGSADGLAEALYGVLLVEIARGDDGPSPGLTQTVTRLFTAFGVIR